MNEYIVMNEHKNSLSKCIFYLPKYQNNGQSDPHGFKNFLRKNI